MLKKLQQSIEINSLKPDLHLATTIRLQALYRQSVCLTGLIECTGQINLTAIASRSQNGQLLHLQVYPVELFHQSLITVSKTLAPTVQLNEDHLNEEPGADGERQHQ